MGGKIYTFRVQLKKAVVLRYARKSKTKSPNMDCWGWEQWQLSRFMNNIQWDIKIVLLYARACSYASSNMLRFFLVMFEPQTTYLQPFLIQKPFC
jgi:hypothetical protein